VGSEIAAKRTIPHLRGERHRWRAAGISELAERRIRDRDTEVVVYRANPGCESSVEVAERLIELGSRTVRHFAGGKRDRAEVRLPLEGGRV